MDKPDMYSRNGEEQVLFVAKHLDQLWSHLTWPKQPQPLPALDIGCGPGDIARKVLAPRLPAGTRLVACDISPEMVDFGRRNNSLGGSITFEILDALDPDMESSSVWKYAPFGKVFAFNVMHWLPDNRLAVQNMHKLLASGGEVIFTIIANMALFAAYEEMAKDSRWANFMQDVKNFVTPYQHSENPVAEFSQLLKSEGFQVLQCDLTPVSLVLQSESQRRDLLKSACAFLNRLPEDLKEEFIDDWLQRAEKMKGLSKDTGRNGEPKYYIHHLSLVAAARKL